MIPGLVAGALGAALMGIVLMLGSSMIGRGFWTPLQQIGAVVVRDRWQEMAALSALIGLVVHFAFGSLLGGIFALVTRRIEARSLLAMLGLVYAGLVYLVMTFLVLPWADPWFIYRTNIGRLLVAYAVFGLMVGLAIPSAERRISERSERAPRVTGRPRVGPA